MSKEKLDITELLRRSVNSQGSPVFTVRVDMGTIKLLRLKCEEYEQEFEAYMAANDNARRYRAPEVHAKDPVYVRLVVGRDLTKLLIDTGKVVAWDYTVKTEYNHDCVRAAFYDFAGETPNVFLEAK